MRLRRSSRRCAPTLMKNFCLDIRGRATDHLSYLKPENILHGDSVAAARMLSWLHDKSPIGELKPSALEVGNCPLEISPRTFEKQKSVLN